ncbi:MAG: hypothetical protein EB060_03955 [Proteobacteria bacterium]|nr:hypothetical protein [Pseudomonadota bacterium]
MKKTQRPKYVFLSIAMAGLIVLPIAAYIGTFSLLQAFPLIDQNTVGRSLLVLSIILVLLVVPYIMLKLVSYVAHHLNKREPEMRLKDIAKDGKPLRRA